jgi:hypothetical protein
MAQEQQKKAKEMAQAKEKQNLVVTGAIKKKP